MEKYKVHNIGTRDFYIVGETLMDAIKSYAEHLVYNSKSDGHLLRDIELELVKYHPGILGGNGGIVARFRAFDLVENVWRLIDAWIYATEADLG